jgi:fructose-bisphosphate aldolase, class II
MLIVGYDLGERVVLLSLMKSIKSLRNYVMEAQRKGVAVSHFNVSDSTQFNGIVEVATALDLPVIIGASEGEASFIGIENVIALVHAARAKGLPVFMNADHHRTYESACNAIDRGVDAVIIDGAKLPLKENIALVQRVVAHARAVTAETGRDVLVEAELGYIGESSKLLASVPDGIQKTDPVVVEMFVRETGVDLFAPAIGNIHGIVESGEPDLDIELVKQIVLNTKIPLVLHGASGNTAEDVQNAIKAGVAIVHINTEIRVAYRKGIEAALQADPREVSPYKYLGAGKEEMKKVVEAKMKLFAGL